LHGISSSCYKKIALGYFIGTDQIYTYDEMAYSDREQSGKIYELFDPSMSALPIIVKQNSPSVGLFTLSRERELGLDRRETG